MSTGLQEWLALLIVAAVAGAILFRRLRSRRRKKRTREASVSPDQIGRRR